MLAVGPLGILILHRRDLDHLAVITLAAQPAEKGAFEQLRVETVSLGAPMLARHRHTRCVNDVGLEAARLEPARQPEAVTASLEGDCNALILRPAFSASSRHRCSSFSNALSSTASFFNGWRSTPGTIPATSQLDRLISMTAISVPFGSRAVRDRLRSFNFCMGRSIGSHQRRWNAISSPPPHSIFHEQSCGPFLLKSRVRETPPSQSKARRRVTTRRRDYARKRVWPQPSMKALRERT